MDAIGFNQRHLIRKLIFVLENILITITTMTENYIISKCSNLKLIHFDALCEIKGIWQDRLIKFISKKK